MRRQERFVPGFFLLFAIFKKTKEKIPGGDPKQDIFFGNLSWPILV